MNYKNFRFRRRLVPIVDTVLEEFEQTYHLLHCFPDVRSLVEPVANIESPVCIVLMREATPILY